MATRTNFIDPEFLRATTDIGPNYNKTNIFNAVADAQEFELVGIIGRNLYEALEAHVVAFRSVDATPIPGPYKNLLEEYISYFLVWTAYFNLLESIYLKPTSAGIGQRVFPGGTAISSIQYEKKRDSVRPKVDHFASRLSQFLTDEGGGVFAELDDSEDLPIDRRQPITSTSSPLLTYRKINRGPNIY